MINKLNLLLNDKVEIHSLGGDSLEGQTGSNLGIAMNDLVTYYIILLDNPTETHLAVLMPEVCLRRI